MLKKHVPLALSLAGLALASSACSPAAPDVPAATVTPTHAVTGWEVNFRGGAERIASAGLTVLNAEGAADHFHAHLDVFVGGKPIPVPADIGFSFGPDGKPNGISALHTHDESGIVHVEAPVVGHTYTLVQVLTEWGVLDGTDKTNGAAHSSTDGWTVTVNGTKQSSVNDVVLKAHDEVVLSYGTAPDPLPTTFEFPKGLR